MPVKRFASFRPSQKGILSPTYSQTTNSVTLPDLSIWISLNVTLGQIPYTQTPIGSGVRLKPIKKIVGKFQC